MANTETAYDELTDLFADLFADLGIPQPSREEFDKIIAPVLQETGTQRRLSQTPDPSMDDNLSFYFRVRQEIAARAAGRT